MFMADANLELAEQAHLPQAAAFSRVYLGQARAQLGRPAEGIALVRRGIAGLIEIGTQNDLVAWMTALAEAQEREGAVAAALDTVERALEPNHPIAPISRPEALRVRGELRLKCGQSEPGDADFREAITLARNMGAKVYEPRATMSLARFLANVGRREDARTMLVEIYGWFTEGFDTADLKDAKALLDELEGTRT
jgi:predicted ATPase